MKILIAEDDEVSRRLLGTYLQRWGHEVTEAADGAAALDLFGKADYPIVIADWLMPRMTGVELISHIRARKSPFYVYIILLTAKTQKEDVVAGIEAGADDYVSKPFDRDELRVRLLAGERVLRLERDLARQNQELRDAQSALVQSEKFASIGQLALGVAHELGGPVEDFSNALYHLRGTLLQREDTAPAADAPGMEPTLPPPSGRDELTLPALDPATADGSINGAAEGGVSPQESDVFADFARCIESVEQVRELVRNLRDFARHDEFLKKQVSLAGAVKDVIQMLRSEINRKQILLEVSLDAAAPVHGNAGKLKKAIMNVLKNAIEAAERGGRIDVRLWTGEKGDNYLEVTDDGPGISPETAQHLFEPFFTTKREAGHAGLGLSISRSILREHGGSVDRIEPDNKTAGTTFRIMLPSPSGSAAHES